MVHFDHPPEQSPITLPASTHLDEATVTLTKELLPGLLYTVLL